MDINKKKKLEAAGWRVGTVDEFLGAMSTTLSDDELRRIGARRRADAVYDYASHGFSVETVANTLARETLELRKLVRLFIDQDETSELAQEAKLY